jgi:hypothetical protein
MAACNIRTQSHDWFQRSSEECILCRLYGDFMQPYQPPVAMGVLPPLPCLISHAYLNMSCKWTEKITGFSPHLWTEHGWILLHQNTPHTMQLEHIHHCAPQIPAEQVKGFLLTCNLRNNNYGAYVYSTPLVTTCMSLHGNQFIRKGRGHRDWAKGWSLLIWPTFEPGVFTDPKPKPHQWLHG